jgi:hypothetical protein
MDVQREDPARTTGHLSRCNGWKARISQNAWREAHSRASDALRVVRRIAEPLAIAAEPGSGALDVGLARGLQIRRLGLSATHTHLLARTGRVDEACALARAALTDASERAA